MLEDAAVSLLANARAVEILAGILLGLVRVVAAVAAVAVAREEELAELFRQVDGHWLSWSVSSASCGQQRLASCLLLRLRTESACAVLRGTERLSTETLVELALSLLWELALLASEWLLESTSSCVSTRSSLHSWSLAASPRRLPVEAPAATVSLILEAPASVEARIALLTVRSVIELGVSLALRLLLQVLPLGRAWVV